ncbi:DUF805 domain-containing protein [Yoonia sp. SS1-5]|uniref:DUF805 domain-containing protein n=1 Tax=Yoonia rhodophyticola TaxID=3137370 RepID=A0AAN0M948_9RHOB
MGPADAIKTCLAKSFQFKGRASRSEFWWYGGLLLVVTFALLWPHATILSTETAELMVIKTSAVTGETTRELERQTEWHLYSVKWNMISITIIIAFYCLITAATVRRLHDVGSSGWFGLTMLLIGPASALLAVGSIHLIFNLSAGLAITIGFILSIASWLVWLICPLILLILLTRPSEEGRTEYGPNPNEASS